MKTYEQRAQDVLAKVKILRRKQAKRAVAAVCVVALALILFLPVNANPPSMRQYRNSPYYDLIRKISIATFQKPSYSNNFERLFSGVLKRIVQTAPGASNESLAPTDANGSYQEVTDNQVEGVIEGDLITKG